MQKVAPEICVEAFRAMPAKFDGQLCLVIDRCPPAECLSASPSIPMGAETGSSIVSTSEPNHVKVSPA